MEAMYMLHRPNKNTHFIVKNIQGTSVYRCGCRSWIDHWRRATKADRLTCAVMGCGNLAAVGAHVISTDMRRDRQWWIAPFCRYHNLHTNKNEMFLDSRIVLVSANQMLTCKSW